jgi:hypothetical protein
VAQRTFVEYVDDLDGDTAAGTVSFQLDGRELEIDLSEQNAATLRSILAPYVAAAREPAGRRRGVSSGATATPGRSREKTRQIRSWLRDNGYDLAERGRIPSELIEAYQSETAASQATPGSELARYVSTVR